MNSVTSYTNNGRKILLICEEFESNFKNLSRMSNNIFMKTAKPLMTVDLYCFCTGCSCCCCGTCCCVTTGGCGSIAFGSVTVLLEGYSTSLSVWMSHVGAPATQIWHNLTLYPNSHVRIVFCSIPMILFKRFCVFSKILRLLASLRFTTSSMILTVYNYTKILTFVIFVDDFPYDSS